MNDRRAVNSLYFVNAWVDAAAIGGLSILAAAILALFSDTSDLGAVSSAIFPLALLVNYPHFSATVYRLYQNPENVRAFPVTSIGLPLLLLGAVAAGLWHSDLIAPYFIALYLLWSPYHYSGQTVGLTMVYARRAGFQIGQYERVALSAFVFSAFVVGTIRMQQAASKNGFIDLNGIVVPSFTFPLWMYWAAMVLMFSGALLFCTYAVAWCLRRGRMLPPIVLLPAATHFIWFVPGSGLKALWALIPAFHSLQYLLIALFVQLKRRTDLANSDAGRPLAAEAVRWIIANMIGGALLFLALPAGLVAIGFSYVTTFGLVFATINIHHFFVDGVIWKLREPSTSSALMTSLSELRETTVAGTMARA